MGIVLNNFAGYIQQYLVMKKKLNKPVDWSGNIDVYSTG